MRMWIPLQFTLHYVKRDWSISTGAEGRGLDQSIWKITAGTMQPTSSYWKYPFLCQTPPPPSQMGTKISCTSPLPLLLDTPSISFQSQWIVISYITSRFAHESACHMHVCPQQKFHTIVYQNVKTLHKWPPLIAVQCQDFYLPDRDYPLDNMIFSLNKN